ncbi:MAG: DJ-1/PfpI family protein [Acidobacteriota bacterium]
MSRQSPRALVPLASGAEEMETTAIVDVLRRAEVEVVLAGLTGTDPVTCSRGLRLQPDTALSDVTGDFDLIALPGGAEGARLLSEDERVLDRLRQQDAAGRLVAAICAAPIVLVAAGVGADKEMTSHPSVVTWKFLVLDRRWIVVPGEARRPSGPERSRSYVRIRERRRTTPGTTRRAETASELPCHDTSARPLVSTHGRYVEDPVVRDGHLITSRGPGTAIEFALALVEATCGPERAAEVRSPMMIPS